MELGNLNGWSRIRKMRREWLLPILATVGKESSGWVAVFDKQPPSSLAANSSSENVERRLCGELRSPKQQALNGR